MKINKYIIGISMLLIGFFAFKYYNNNYGNSSLKTNPLLAISERATSFVYTKNINKLNKKLDSLVYLESLNDNLLFSKFKSEIYFLDTLFNKNDDTLKYNKFVLSAFNIGSSKIEYLSILELDDKISLAKIKNIFKSKIDNYKYQKYKIYTTKINKQEIAFALYNNLILFSKNIPLVEEALNTLGKENQKTNTEIFNKFINNNLTVSDLHLFIDYEASKDLESIIFNYEVIKDIEPSDVKWSYSSINFNEKDIDLKTNYLFKESSNYSLNTNPVVFSLDSFLPNNTAYFEATCSKKNRIFQSNDISYKFFKPWLDEEIAFFSLETFEEDYQKRSGLVLKTNNIDSAKLYLYLLNKEMSPIVEQAGFAIYKMNVQAISKLFKSRMFHFNNPYFMFIDKYVVFSDEISVLTACKAKYKSKSYLAKNSSYNSFIGNNYSNNVVYLNPQRWVPTLDNIFTKNINFKNWGKLINETFVTDSSLFSVARISFEKEKIKHTIKIWEVGLDTVSNFKTQIVLNADNKRKELITQDEKNQVYLINQSGEIIFKKQIKEKIIGDVYQIDYFKTNKLQYVFNTKNYIYVMQRNGKLVAGFPLKLPAESNNSIFVINYDKSKKYRFFVACKNNKVYGYEANGKPLKSWSPLGEFGEIHNSIKHASFSDKDYLFFSSNGTFHAFNRKGEQRFDAINLGTNFNQAFEKTKKGFINFTDGSIYKIDLKGKTTAKILADSTYNIFTNYEEKGAFAIANNNEIRIVKSKWTILGKKKLNDKILSIEKVKILSETWFLVNCEKSVYLVDEKCEIHPDFPKIANSKARVSKFYNNKSEIIIFNEGNKLKAFQLVLPN